MKKLLTILLILFSLISIGQNASILKTNVDYNQGSYCFNFNGIDNGIDIVDGNNHDYLHFTLTFYATALPSGHNTILQLVDESSGNGIFATSTGRIAILYNTGALMYQTDAFMVNIGAWNTLDFTINRTTRIIDIVINGNVFQHTNYNFSFFDIGTTWHYGYRNRAADNTLFLNHKSYALTIDSRVINFIGIGDSNTSGTGLAADEIITYKLDTSLTNDYIINNAGIGSLTAVQVIVKEAAGDYNDSCEYINSKRIACVQIGINDIAAGSTTANVISRLNTIYTELLSDDFVVIANTIPKLKVGTYSSEIVGNWNDTSAIINTWILNQTLTTKIVDLRDVIEDADLQADGIHLTTSGTTKWFTLLDSTISTISLVSELNLLNIQMNVGFGSTVWDVDDTDSYIIDGAVSWGTHTGTNYNATYGMTKVKYLTDFAYIPYLLSGLPLYPSVSPVINAAEQTMNFPVSYWQPHIILSNNKVIKQ